ncbi:Protein of unknown function [Thermobacillus xylanilyticus]|uniref:Uncharacterized protein n=1 Tax=Thermobacillus xylanilyticus TaxID=76633 RepID=A0ABM8V3I6_THEXY|nr:Protein of unknown function [Thermobacillus xylanilyticus]
MKAKSEYREIGMNLL